MLITSNQNPKYKELLKLKEKKYRIKEKKFILEGKRIIEHGIKLGFMPLAVFYDSRADLAKLQGMAEGMGYELEHALFSRISDTMHSQGVIAIFDMNEINIGIKAGNEKIIILNSISDPGNMGSILRSAEAFGYNKVYITKGSCDPYSDKVLRSTMGAIFKIELNAGFESGDLINYLKRENTLLIASSLSERTITLEEATKHSSLISSNSHALVFGNEGSGIDEDFYQNADILYKIAMPGSAESLNVAAAAAISLYTFSVSLS